MKNVFDNVLDKLNFKKVFKKPERKKSVLKELLKNPDGFMLTAFVENDEIKISIKKMQKKEEEV